MAWFRVDDTLPDHWKVGDLAEELRISDVLVVGHIVMLWAWVNRFAADGSLAGLDDRIIAKAARWKKDPRTFIDALHKHGLLDKTPAGYAVHDWAERSGRFYEADKKAKQREKQQGAGPGPCVYFVREHGTGPAKRVKIGWSTNVLRQIRSLETSEGIRVELIGWIKTANAEEERRIHQRFAHLREGGSEWFGVDPELQQFIIEQTLSREWSRDPRGPGPRESAGPFTDGRTHDTHDTDDRKKEAASSNAAGEQTAPVCAEVAERPTAPAETAFLIFPTVRGRRAGQNEWSLTEAQVRELEETFPAVDVRQQCREALLWCKTHPRALKTSGGMPDFLRRWMAKEQDRGRATNGTSHEGPLTAAEANIKRVRSFVTEVKAKANGKEETIDVTLEPPQRALFSEKLRPGGVDDG